MNALPDWVASGTPVSLPAPPRRRRLLRMLAGGAAALSTLPGALLARPRKATPLSALDPRAKVISCALLVVSCSLLRGLPALGAATGFALLCAFAAGVMRSRVAGAFLAVPLLSGIVLAPATLNLISPGEALITLFRLPSVHIGGWVAPSHLEVTREGLASALRVLLRTVASAGFLLALTSCTTPADLLGGLSALGLPRGASATLRMMGRYLTTLADAARDIHLAKLSRCLHPPSGRRGRAWASASVAELFRRSRRMADEVALAMASRGYRGQVRELPPGAMRGPEWICLLLACASAGWLLFFDGSAR